MSPALIVVGIGNRFRRDDAVGLVVAERLRAGSDGLDVRTESGEGVALMERWKSADGVVLIDAVSSDTPPGTVHRWKADAEPIPARYFRYSTHAFSVPEAIELARALDRLPRCLIVYGVVGKDFQAGEGLSPDVERAVDDVVQQIQRDLERVAAAEDELHA